MKKIQIICLWLLATVGVGALTGCYYERRPVYYAPGPPGPPPPEPEYTYVYYPDAEVYFEPHRHIYFWADGGVWRNGPRLPSHYVLHSHVDVRLRSAEPFRHHEEVRRRYPVRREDDRRGHDHGGR